MIPALVLLGYAACAAWCGPAALTPLTSRGMSVRAGLAAWLIAMGSVLASAVLAIEISLRTAAGDWPQLTRLLCRSVAGSACTPEVYRSILYQGGVAVLAILLTLVAAVALWRYGRRVQRSRRQTRAHADAARIVGRNLRGSGEAVVLDDPRPAAYCVAGRPAAIVVTSGALAILDPPQLGAVLAHERAHLAHRHHLLATLTQGLAAAFPGVPLFTQGDTAVARLAEMAADDAAACAFGRSTLATALLAIAAGRAVPGVLPAGPATVHPATADPVTTGGASLPHAGLAATAHSVPARVERMLCPPRPSASVLTGAVLTALSAFAAVAPVLLATTIG